jgi:hypothetical protein
MASSHLGFVPLMEAVVFTQEDVSIAVSSYEPSMPTESQEAVGSETLPKKLTSCMKCDKIVA